ncbi:MAG: ATP-binding protein [Methanosarcinales archaeon]
MGNRFSYRKISSSLSIDIDTTIRYIRYIEKTYLFFLVNFFSFSSRAVMQKEKKVYLIDTGLANAISISTNEPALVENCVFTHLIRTFKNISYWRDVEEVDFVINIDNVPIPVEVKYRNKIERKYTRSVIKFCRKFNVNRGIIVTKNDLNKEIIDEIEIWFIPVWLFIAVI